MTDYNGSTRNTPEYNVNQFLLITEIVGGHDIVLEYHSLYANPVVTIKTNFSRTP